MHHGIKTCVAKYVALLGLSFAIHLGAEAQVRGVQSDALSYFFEGHYGQVEVGGRYVGLEFHQSRPVPSRVSFYYPVANSIDLSTDYWRRGRSLPMALGVRVGTGPVKWISRESWSYILSPHRVTFVKETDSLHFAISYDFCFNEPAAVLSVTIRNVSGNVLALELYTHLILSVRTCQTYARKDTSLVNYDGLAQVLSARFETVDTDSAAVFVQNAGEVPVQWAFEAAAVGGSDEGGSTWPFVRMEGNRDSIAHARRRGVAAYVYRKSLVSSDSLQVIQIVGSCRGSEVEERSARLRSRWRQEIREYDHYIRAKAGQDARFSTGEPTLDRSALWARGLIAANAHYLHGAIVPMPCPSEYNFFFTHDLLLTNLGAVQFDLVRVKMNLLYLLSLTNDNVIPHAYYWRDDGFKTEYCEPENWNHLWFILVSGSYLRHSLDDSTGRILYPVLTKSLTDALTRLNPDGLMYAYRPDWWDIGHIEGPRAYLTALTIRALREYLFISAFLHLQNPRLKEYEQTADRMQRALVDRLWDRAEGYLTNYNEGTKDYHVYAGSLVASVYGLLDLAHSKTLVATAGKRLLDDRIGVRIAVPVDFNSDSVIAKFRFAGEEAGPPYAYANGGVWPHGNAWYAMALKAIGRPDESFEFVRRTMTLDGVAQSPNGLPAMYEYRYSNRQSPDFGAIDKPAFLWAGGMYLQTLYRLFVTEEPEWNISVSSTRPSQCDSVVCSLSFGNVKELTVKRVRHGAGLLTADGEIIPSCILPLQNQSKQRWQFEANAEGIPVLESASAVVHRVTYDPTKRRLACEVSSFDEHWTEITVASTRRLKRAIIDGVRVTEEHSAILRAGRYFGTVRFSGKQQHQHVVFEY